MVRCRMKIKFIFAWYDFYVGLYVDREKKRYHLFLLPTLGIVFDFSRSDGFCDHCRLPDDEGCGFPWYGMAPHDHKMRVSEDKKVIFGPTILAGRDTWPSNFFEDPECKGFGTYRFCPECGAYQE